jgi:hypothetical protein
MELSQEQKDQYSDYLASFDSLMGDARTKTTFTEVIQGIIGSESLCAARIARFSPHACQQQVG